MASTTNEKKQQVSELNLHSKKKKAPQTLNHDPILVPPPPPEQPSLLNWSNLTVINEPINLLNENELKQKSVNLQKEISNIESSLDEQKGEISEAQERAERFVSLYSEGVVSRRELEIAKKQVTEKERSLQEIKSKLDDLKAEENAILRRLDSFKKISKNKQHTSKITKKKISDGQNQKQ